MGKQFQSDAADAARANLDPFTAGYIECIYFTETGDGGQPSSEITMSAEAIEQAKEECAEFQKNHAPKLEAAYACEGYDATRAGHDFWYTRNGHGVGFWDRDELGDELGEALSVAARDYAVCDAYEGDDGLLYLS